MVDKELSVKLINQLHDGLSSYVGGAFGGGAKNNIHLTRQTAGRLRAAINDGDPAQQANVLEELEGNLLNLATFGAGTASSPGETMIGSFSKNEMLKILFQLQDALGIKKEK